MALLCAYSLAQQLGRDRVTIALAVALVVWAFGWAGGSYSDAKVKVAEQKAHRAAARNSLCRTTLPEATAIQSPSNSRTGRRPKWRRSDDDTIAS
jgi:hypothetical protein